MLQLTLILCHLRTCGFRSTEMTIFHCLDRSNWIRCISPGDIVVTMIRWRISRASTVCSRPSFGNHLLVLDLCLACLVHFLVSSIADTIQREKFLFSKSMTLASIMPEELSFGKWLCCVAFGIPMSVSVPTPNPVCLFCDIHRLSCGVVSMSGFFEGTNKHMFIEFPYLGNQNMRQWLLSENPHDDEIRSAFQALLQVWPCAVLVV